jgi:hypothetical protein
MFFGNSFFAIILVLVVASVGELILASLWAPFYFRYGIPLLRRSYTVPADLDLTAQIPRLERSLPRTWWRPFIVFRQLSATELAFRNGFGSRNPLQGLVRLEPGNGRLTISGHLYTSYLLYPLAFVPFLLNGFMPAIFLLFLAAAFVFAIGMQRRHYEQIASVIAETLGGQRGDDTAVSPTPLSFPQNPVTYKPGKQETWSPETNDPFAPTPRSPNAGLSKIELLLIVVLVVLAAAVGWFLLLMFTTS